MGSIIERTMILKSVPGTLIPEVLEEEPAESLIYQHEPVHLEHEILLTDLPEAA